MKPIYSPLSPLSFLAARLRRARPGSVLIIVIVLLLLLAILGAAYISTTRSARVASAQGVLNADVDGMIAGISKVCEGVVVNDINVNEDSTGNFGDLRGNTAYGTAATNKYAYRSYYQGQAGTAPTVTPNVPNTPTGYNPGDIVNDATNPVLFYTLRDGQNAPTGKLVVTAGSNWEILNGHLPITALGTNPWLASRIPTRGTTANPVWRYLSQSIQVSVPYPGGAPMSVIGTDFEDPTYPNGNVSFSPPRNPTAPTGTVITSFLAVNGPLVGGTTTVPAPLYPTYMTLPNGTHIPALSYAVPPTNGPTNTFAAGDADGDGVADSFLFRIPGASSDGLTWYAAVRIIDNNSAINANTAWNRGANPLVAAGAVDVWNLFPTSVGLSEMLSTSGAPPDAIAAVNTYCFGNQAGASLAPLDETLAKPPTTVARPDYSFIGQNEAYYQQFIRRMANPGINTGTTRYQALPLADEAALANHFCLQNSSSMSQTIIESLLKNSLCGTTASPVRSTPYDPIDTGPSTSPGPAGSNWFTANFDYTNGDPIAAPMSLRPLLVTHNPVSGYIPQVYNNNGGLATPAPIVDNYDNNYGLAANNFANPILPNYMLPYGPETGTPGANFKGVWTVGTTYAPNDIVAFPGPPTSPTGPNNTYIALAASTGTAPATLNAQNVALTTTNTAWETQSWTQNPVKANVNIATFRELFRAFWCVMAGNPSNATPFGYTGDPVSIYDDTVTNPQFQFRSPLRDATSFTPGAAAGSASELDGTATTKPSNNITKTKVATNTNAMLLRAAIAAVNTLGLRDNHQDIISKTIILKNAFVAPTPGGAPASSDVEVRVYSNAPQPFIAEVYVNTNAGPDPTGTSPTSNPAGYVAVELFNPYPVPLTLINWTLAYVNRGAKYPDLQLNTIGTVGTTAAPVVIQPSGYLLIENCKYATAPTTQPDAGSATYRPVDSNILPTIPTTAWAGPKFPPTPATQPSTPGGLMYADLYMPFLETVIKGAIAVPPGQTSPSLGGELVLLRPRRADGTPTTYVDPVNGSAVGSESFDENGNPADMIPVDSYDFTNLQQQAPAAPYQVWNYVRANGNDANGNYRFKATYPGPYNIATTQPTDSRETGTYPQVVAATASPVFDPAGTGVGSATQPSPSTQPSPGTTSSGTYANNFPPIQVYNVGPILISTNTYSSHFANPVGAPNTTSLVYTSFGGPPPAPYYHPLGGFARNGDMLDIPFVGAYRIRVLNPGDATFTYPTTDFLELNSLPMDCSLAAVETNIPAEDAAQNIGRFVPMAAHVQGYAGPDYYAWARNLFTYLTAQSSNDARLPNFNPNYRESNYTGTPGYAYPPASATPPYPPTPVLTSDGTVSDQTKQDTVGAEGLININTASWKVLSMLPFVPTTTAGAASLNRITAQEIVLYRDGDGTPANPAHGPFMSIFDLNQVTGFQLGQGAFNLTAKSGPTAPTSANGLLSPADQSFGTSTPNTIAPLQGEEDYQGDCLTLTRISNLVTTRSDTFTIYVELQGWQNAGSTNAALPPQPAVTRHYAYIVDRSAISGDPTGRFAKTVTVPND